MQPIVPFICVRQSANFDRPLQLIFVILQRGDRELAAPISISARDHYMSSPGESVQYHYTSAERTHQQGSPIEVPSSATEYGWSNDPAKTTPRGTFPVDPSPQVALSTLHPPPSFQQQPQRARLHNDPHHPQQPAVPTFTLRTGAGVDLQPPPHAHSALCGAIPTRGWPRRERTSATASRVSPDAGRSRSRRRRTRCTTLCRRHITRTHAGIHIQTRWARRIWTWRIRPRVARLAPGRAVGLVYG